MSTSHSSTSLTSSTVHFAKLLISGYSMYKEPTRINTETFFSIFSDLFNNDERKTSDGVNASDESKTYENILDEKNDNLAEEDDKSDIVCQICTVNRRNVVLVPCNHSVTCIACVKEIEKLDNKCPICRIIIDKKVFYISS